MWKKPGHARAATVSLWALFLWGAASGFSGGAGMPVEPLRIKGVSADGRALKISPGGAVRLPARERLRVNIGYGPARSEESGPAWRNLHRMEGVDREWMEDLSYMRLDLQFFDGKGRVSSNTLSRHRGRSPGWDETAGGAPEFNQRSVRFTVPPGVASMRAALFSGGPPKVMGVVGVANLRIYRLREGDRRELAADWSVRLEGAQGSAGAAVPRNWRRAGENAGMASTETIRGLDALVIRNNDSRAYASWELSVDQGIAVEPGASYEALWQEMYSVGGTGECHDSYELTAPGRYRFRVVNATIDGTPVGEETSLELILPAPLTQRPWFLLLCGGAVAGAVLGGWRYLEVNRQKLALAIAREQRAVEQERVRIARDIHDDFGVSLTQIAHQCELMEDHIGDPGQIRLHLRDLSQSARALVNAVDEIVWAVNPSNDTVEKFTAFVGHFVQSTVHAANLTCRLALPKAMLDMPMSSILRHHLYLITKEALNNAICHSAAQTIRFTLRLDEDVLTMIIADDGCGFDEEATRSGRLGGGNGLTNMRQRMAEVGGLLRIESGQGSGTAVTMEVKLCK